jgi:hypothetical protein
MYRRITVNHFNQKKHQPYIHIIIIRYGRIHVYLVYPNSRDQSLELLSRLQYGYVVDGMDARSGLCCSCRGACGVVPAADCGNERRRGKEEAT